MPRLAAPCGLSASLTAVHRTAPLPVASLPLAMFTRRWQQRLTPRGLSWVPAPCALQERVQLPPPRSPRCAVAAGQQGPGLLSRSSPWPQRPGPARSRELPPRHGAFAPTLPCECRARGHRVTSVLHRAADLCGPPWPLAVCPAPRPRGRHRRALGRCACRVVSAQCRGRGDLPPPGRPPPAVPAVPRIWDPAAGSRRGAEASLLLKRGFLPSLFANPADVATTSERSLQLLNFFFLIDLNTFMLTRPHV